MNNKLSFLLIMLILAAQLLVAYITLTKPSISLAPLPEPLSSATVCSNPLRMEEDSSTGALELTATLQRIESILSSLIQQEQERAPTSNHQTSQSELDDAEALLRELNLGYEFRMDEVLLLKNHPSPHLVKNRAAVMQALSKAINEDRIRVTP